MQCPTRMLWIVAVSFLSLTSAAPAVESVPAPGEESYFVFAGGCSRSIHRVATFDDARGACRHAATLRGKFRYLGIADVDDPFLAIPAFRPEDRVRSYSVYELTNDAWRLTKTIDDAKAANSLAEKLRDGGRQVEIVLHTAQR